MISGISSRRVSRARTAVARCACGILQQTGTMAAAMFTTVVPLGIVWDAKTKLLFVHIPKSAGMSIELAMGEAMLTRDGEAYHARTRNDRHVICPACVNDTSSKECKGALGSTSVLYNENAGHNTEHAAHITMRRCRLYTGRIRSFAIIRNPLDRLISGYNWMLSHGENAGSFMDFVSNYRLHLFKRPQSEYVSPCTTIFAYERLDDVWDFLAEMYPTMNRRRVRHVNMVVRSSFVPHRNSIAKVMTQFRDDWELWLNALARSSTKGWWRNPPCNVSMVSNQISFNMSVEDIWRTLTQDAKSRGHHTR